MKLVPASVGGREDFARTRVRRIYTLAGFLKPDGFYTFDKRDSEAPAIFSLQCTNTIKPVSVVTKPRVLWLLAQQTTIGDEFLEADATELSQTFLQGHA